MYEPFTILPFKLKRTLFCLVPDFSCLAWEISEKIKTVLDFFEYHTASVTDLHCTVAAVTVHIDFNDLCSLWSLHHSCTVRSTGTVLLFAFEERFFFFNSHYLSFTKYFANKSQSQMPTSSTASHRSRPFNLFVLPFIRKSQNPMKTSYFIKRY